ncbi:aminopeptidase P family protein [Flavihumibacter sp. R14]|nr:aminopeptidase P family protein [Flavihumibacter soli]
MKILTYSVLLFLCLSTTKTFAQVDIPMFTTHFPAEEFAARRNKVYDAIGKDAIAVLQGAPSPAGYVRFRQNNEFYYLSGIEVPHAYLVLNGASRTASLYLPHRHEGRERSEGKMLAAEDADLIKKLSGIENVYGAELMTEGLSRTTKTVFTPFAPAEGMAMSRDLAVRALADAASDSWDGSGSREGSFVNKLKSRFPKLDIQDLTPTLDALRLIKSPLEIEQIKKASRLSGLSLMEAMRSVEPGMYEYELDAAAKYIYYRNGAQGDAYYSLIASAENAYYPHYNAGKRLMKDGDFLLMDYSPDYAYYMSDLTRMMPVNGKFSAVQRELYGFYLGCYKAILKHIKPGETAQAIKKLAAADMKEILAASKFSKPIYADAAKRFVESYDRSTANAKSNLGHWIGMSTHDVGGYDGSPLRAGMVFTIEPALTVPEERIYIRLEDAIVITEKGAEIISDFIPMEMAEIEKLMKEKGILQAYPKN